MLIETDSCKPSGKGTAMYSKHGASTISYHLCFRTNDIEKFK
jgi:hypothetical protein